MPSSADTSLPDTSRGYTLIELLVTIALASLLLSIAVPSFKHLAVGNRLTTQANEFVSVLSLARSEAIKRNSAVTLCRAKSESASACETASGAWQHWIVRAANGTIVRRGLVNTFGGGISVKSTLSNDTIVFGPDGLSRTGSSIVADHKITVCAPDVGRDNIRDIVLGSASRISTVTKSGSC